LKPVAWAKKNAPIFIGASLPKQIIVARIYSIHPRSKTRMVSNRFWHIVSVVKERAPLSSRKALLQPKEYLSSPLYCQHHINIFHSLPHGIASALLTGRTSHHSTSRRIPRVRRLLSQSVHFASLRYSPCSPALRVLSVGSQLGPAPSKECPHDCCRAYVEKDSSLSHQAHAI
jgi:hypothetical protein